MQEAEQFMHLQNQVIEEVTGNKRDKDGNMFSVNLFRGSQGSQGEQEKLTNQIYEEDGVMRTKKKVRIPVETILEQNDFNTQQPTPAVKWHEDVYDKQSRQAARERVNIINNDVLNTKITPSDTKNKIQSTTEINIILQQRLGHASVDELISRKELTHAQIARNLLIRPRSNSKTNIQEIRRNSTIPQKREQLPKSRIIKKLEEKKVNAGNTPKKLVVVKSVSSPRNKNISSPINKAQSNNNRLPTKLVASLPSNILATMKQSSLKKRSNFYQKDVHEGLEKLEKYLQNQTEKPFQTHKSNRRNTLVHSGTHHSIRSAKNPKFTSQPTQSSNSTIKSWMPSKEESEQFDVVYNDYSSDKKKNITRNIKPNNRIAMGLMSTDQVGKESPLMSKITSNNLSRNRSVSQISIDTESLVMTLKDCYGDTQLKPRIQITDQLLDSSNERDTSILNNSASKQKSTKMKKSDSSKQYSTVLNPYSEKVTQAQMFAMMTGGEPVTNEQDKDERYGRVVRDFKMLEDNKSRMRQLISLLALESEEAGNHQRKEQLDQMKVGYNPTDQNHFPISNKVFTPKSEFRSDPNQSIDEKDASVLPKINLTYQNQSITRASSTIHDHPMKNKNAFSYKKIQTLDISGDVLSGEADLKLIPDDKTSLQQKNFKYFLVKPHIYTSNGLLIKRQQRLPSLVQINNESLSVMVTNNRPGFPQSTLDMNRPTSFNGQRSLPRNMFTSEHNSGLIKQTMQSDYNQQIGRADFYESNRQDTNLFQSEKESLQNASSLNDPLHAELVSEREYDGFHDRTKSQNVFAISSNIRIPYQASSLDMQNYQMLDQSNTDLERLNTNFASQNKRQLKVCEVKSRIDTNHKQKQQLSYGQTNYSNPLTYVMVKGRVKPTFEYIVSTLPYAEPVLSHIQKQHFQMKINENHSQGKFKTLRAGHEFNFGSPFKKTPIKDLQLISTNKQFLTEQDQDLQVNKQGKKSKKLSNVRTSQERDKTESQQSDIKLKKPSSSRKQKRKRVKAANTAIDKLKVNNKNEMEDEAIMEMSQEGSDISDNYLPKDPNKDQNWEEIFYENEQLKVQIASQITIFEQYLRVAMLQEHQREIEMKRQEKIISKGIFDGMEVILDKTKPGNTKEEQASLFQDLEAEKTRLKQRSKLAEKKFVDGYQKTREDRPNSTRSARSTSSQRSKSGNGKNLHQLNKQRSQSASSTYSDSKPQKQFAKNASVQMLKQIQATDQMKRRKNKDKQGLAYRFMRFISTSASKVIIMPKLGVYGYNLQNDSHNTHQMWLDKIEAIWKKLEQYQNSEAKKYETMIELNQRRLFDFTRDNVFELEVQTNDQKMLLRAKFNVSKMKQALKQTKEERMLRKVQKKLRRAINKNEELSQWGLQNYVCSYQIKCRMIEEIIDLAQRLLLKPDQSLEAKMQRLQRLRDQTYQDLDYFVSEREKVHWRNWDHMFMGNWKPEIPPKKNLLRYYTERCDLNLIQIEYLELQSLQLQSDINGFNSINSDSIKTVTERFGHDHWLHFWQIQQLRKKQTKRLFMHDPSQEHLLALKEPVLVELYHQKRQKLDQIPQKADDYLGVFRLPQSKKVQFKDEKNPLASVVAEGMHIESIDTDQADQVSPDKENAHLNYMHYQAQKALDLADSIMLKDEGNQDGEVVIQGQAYLNKDLVVEETKEGQAQTQEQKPYVSKWLQAISKSKKEQEEKERKEREARVARLQKLFDVDDDDHGISDTLDKHAAEKKLADYLGKIDTHLRVELQLLDAWQDKPHNAQDAQESTTIQ